jgi:hypothetical protein
MFAPKPVLVRPFFRKPTPFSLALITPPVALARSAWRGCGFCVECVAGTRTGTKLPALSRRNSNGRYSCAMRVIEHWNYSAHY